MINEEPTMSAGNGGFSGSAAAKGPVAGLSKPLKKRYIYQRGLSKNWKKSGES